MTKHAMLPAVLAVALASALGLATAQAGERVGGASPSRGGVLSESVQVSQFNNLNKFRRLNGGSKLVVPPLIPPEPGR